MFSVCIQGSLLLLLSLLPVNSQSSNMTTLEVFGLSTTINSTVENIRSNDYGLSDDKVTALVLSWGFGALIVLFIWGRRELGMAPVRESQFTGLKVHQDGFDTGPSSRQNPIFRSRADTLDTSVSEEFRGRAGTENSVMRDRLDTEASGVLGFDLDNNERDRLGTTESTTSGFLSKLFGTPQTRERLGSNVSSPTGNNRLRLASSVSTTIESDLRNRHETADSQYSGFGSSEPSEERHGTMDSKYLGFNVHNIPEKDFSDSEDDLQKASADEPEYGFDGPQIHTKKQGNMTEVMI
eukprot:m.26932 g.26932  ORF g.26932 m.26932 type:complete len:295 (+) comp7847_c0_seq1:412-1296(+)